MEDVSDPPFRAVCKQNGADLMYTEFISSEGLIRDAIKGDRTLFVRRDELEQAWAWIDQIHAARKAARAPLLHYPAGCHGPDFE